MGKHSRILSGFEPSVVNSLLLRFNGGSCADWRGNETYGRIYAIDVHADQQGGIGGMDPHYWPPAQNSDWRPVLCVQIDQNGHEVCDAEGPILGIFMTRAKGTTEMVANTPAGWKAIRALPWAAVYKTNWGGFAPMAFKGGYPRLQTHYTLSENVAPYEVCYQLGGAAYAWQTLSLVPWMPDTARMCKLRYKIEAPAGSQAGTWDIRSTAAQAYGITLGSVSVASMPWATGSVELAVSSTRTIQVRRNSSGPVLSMWFESYTQTEPS